MSGNENNKENNKKDNVESYIESQMKEKEAEQNSKYRKRVGWVSAILITLLSIFISPLFLILAPVAILTTIFAPKIMEAFKSLKDKIFNGDKKEKTDSEFNKSKDDKSKDKNKGKLSEKVSEKINVSDVNVKATDKNVLPSTKTAPKDMIKFPERNKNGEEHDMGKQ